MARRKKEEEVAVHEMSREILEEREEEEEEEEEAPFRVDVPEDLETQRRMLWAVDFFYGLEDDRVSILCAWCFLFAHP